MAIVAKSIRPIKGNIVKGFGETEKAMRTSKWWRSNAIAFNGDTSNTVFNLPSDVLVVGGFIEVETAFEASGTSAAATATLTIPNDTGTETLYDAANVGLQTSGFKPCTAFSVTPSSGGSALLLLDPGTTTVGQLRVYLEIVQLDSSL